MEIRPIMAVFATRFVQTSLLSKNCTSLIGKILTIRGIQTSQCRQNDRRFTEKHEWVRVQGNLGTVGISDYAQDALGDIVYAQLPDLQAIVKKDDEVGALESVKAASEVISPVSGKVVEKNKNVEERPALINSSPYDEGWLFKIELSEPSELSTLMDEKAYKEFIKTTN